jgi:Flp pilus assembly protein CpaB
MRESLDPAWISRVSQSLRPDWTRTVLVRRIVAGGLVVLAGIAALRSNPDGDRVQVVVAVRDISGGSALTDADVILESRLATTVPDGAPTDLAAVRGATLTGPARRGEVLTDVRLLGQRLAEATAGPDARIVGVHPADGALIDLLHPGDVVDVLAASDTDPQASPRMVATGGVVVLVSEQQKSTGDERVVLVALPATAANAVAGAALVAKVTLTLR